MVEKLIVDPNVVNSVVFIDQAISVLNEHVNRHTMVWWESLMDDRGSY